MISTTVTIDFLGLAMFVRNRKPPQTVWALLVNSGLVPGTKAHVPRIFVNLDNISSGDLSSFGEPRPVPGGKVFAKYDPADQTLALSAGSDPVQSGDLELVDRGIVFKDVPDAGDVDDVYWVADLEKFLDRPAIVDPGLIAPVMSDTGNRVRARFVLGKGSFSTLTHVRKDGALVSFPSKGGKRAIADATRCTWITAEHEFALHRRRSTDPENRQLAPIHLLPDGLGRIEIVVSNLPETIDTADDPAIDFDAYGKLLKPPLPGVAEKFRPQGMLSGFVPARRCIHSLCPPILAYSS